MTARLFCSKATIGGQSLVAGRLELELVCSFYKPRAPRRRFGGTDVERNLDEMNFLFNNTFQNVYGSQFRRLTRLFIARADMFDRASSVLHVYNMIIDHAGRRHLDSIDIAAIQVMMLKELSTFKASSSSVEGMRKIFAPWAYRVEPGHLVPVMRAWAKEIETYKSGAHRQEAEQVLSAFLIEIRNRH